MIEFNHVIKRYPNGHVAINDVSFKLERGEMVFLTGHSGAGKTTFLKLMLGIERATSGQINVAGMNLNRISSRKIPQLRKRIGVIFQSPHLLNDQTVFDNVALPLIISGYSKNEIGKRVRAALDKVGLLNKEKYNPQDLSAGEQQRVGIARAVVNKPVLLLADEPTGNLDPQLALEIMRFFEEFNQVGVSVLIASHDLALIAKLRHRILTLKDGQMVG